MPHGLSVVIPARNESMLRFTVERCFATATIPIEIIVVDDGSDRAYYIKDLADVQVPPGCRLAFHRFPISLGTHCCADFGIQQAHHKAVLIIDGHMNWWDIGTPNQTQWDEYLSRFADGHPEAVACCVCPQLTSDDMAMKPDRARYFGAKFKLKHIYERTFGNAIDMTQRKEPKILEGVWSTDESIWRRLGYEDGGRHKVSPGMPVELPILMGGAYLINRDFYMHQCCSVLSGGAGWGSVEAFLSLTAWLMGGTTFILPVEIGHMFRTHQVATVPYVTMQAHVAYNQMFMARLIGRDDLIAHLRLDVWPPDVRNAAGMLLDRSILPLVKMRHEQALKEDFGRTFADYCAYWSIDPELPKETASAQP